MGQNLIQGFLAELPAISEELPYSPEVLRLLFLQSGDGYGTSIGEAGDVLSGEEFLTESILGLANCGYYGLQSKVDSVTGAAAVLGMAELRNMVLVSGISGLTRANLLPADFDLAAFWQHEFLVAAISKEISRVIDVGNAENLTAGLVHDLGKLITALKRGNDWQAIQDLMEDDEVTEAEAEEEYWGVDHTVVGAAILTAWDIPAVLVEPVNWHHSPALAPEHSNEAAVVGLADTVAHAVEDPDSSYTAKLDELCDEMDVDMDELLELGEELMESDDIEQFVCVIA